MNEVPKDLSLILTALKGGFIVLGARVSDIKLMDHLFAQIDLIFV